jgi:hypothetical protein
MALVLTFGKNKSSGLKGLGILLNTALNVAVIGTSTTLPVLTDLL